MRTNTLVRYHGSKTRYHGHILRVLGRCDCARHPYAERRYRLAYRSEDELLLQCVREKSITRVTVAQANAAQEQPLLGDEEPDTLTWYDAFRWTPEMEEPPLPGDDLDDWLAGLLEDAADDEPGWEMRILAADRLLTELDNESRTSTEGPQS